MNNKHSTLILVILSLLLCTSCNKKPAIDDSNNSNEFSNNVENVLEMVKGFNNQDYLDGNIRYFIENGYLFGVNTFEDVSNYNFNYGSIIKKDNNEIYLSIENDEYCAIMDFGDTNISVYNISEWGKCHRTYIDGDEIRLSIMAINLSSGKEYKDNTISDDYISLSIVDNILDKRSYKLAWYRNGEKINDLDVSDYFITLDQEDAEYYVEIVTIDGQIFKSEPINVKINRITS